MPHHFAKMFLIVATILPVTAQITPHGFLRSSNRVPGSYIVVLKNNISKADIPASTSRLVAAHNGRMRFQYDAALKGFAIEMTEDEALDMANDPDVQYVEEDSTFHAVTTQNFPPVGLDRIDQTDLPLNSTFNYSFDGTGVNAYVIDSGIRKTNVDFGNRVTLSYDAVGDGQNGNDCNGHGTHVAGILGGSTYGVAKNVKLYAIRVLGCSNTGSVSNFVAGINWLTATALWAPTVANISLAADSKSASLETAVRSLVGHGVIVTVAAGNDNDDANNHSPSDVTEALIVGSISGSDSRSSFSNFGSVLDLFAPGENILSDWYTSDTATQVLQGTSMAAPHVAGVAATYLQSVPIATPADVASVLVANATSGRLTGIGTGSPNLLLYSPWVGSVTLPHAFRPTTDVDSPTVVNSDCYIYDSGASNHISQTSTSGANARDSEPFSTNAYLFSYYPGPGSGTSMQQRLMSGWSNVSGYSSLLLKVTSQCQGYSGTRQITACGSEYSLNGGTTWTTIYSVHGLRSEATDAIPLSSTQDLTQLRVRYCSSGSVISGGPSSSGTISVYDVRVEGR